MERAPLILWLRDVAPHEQLLVGGKGFNLALMLKNLASLGVLVPNGFVVTTASWHCFLNANKNLRDDIENHLKKINFKEPSTIQRESAHIWNIITNAEMPQALKQGIIEAYNTLAEEYKENITGLSGVLDVAVRSSTPKEDKKVSSFAGQHSTYLNVRYSRAVVQRVINCFASLFTERAIVYRTEKGFPLFPEDGIAVVVQKMVRSDKACSGVAFSHEPLSQAPHLVCIQGGWGLGEAVVSGAITPDTFTVMKPPRHGKQPSLREKVLGTKDHKLVYGYRDEGEVLTLETTSDERQRFCLTDEEIFLLTGIVLKIEAYYGYPVDVEWAKDGNDGNIYIVQARPATSLKDPTIITMVRVIAPHDARILLTGAAASPGAAHGLAQFILDPHNTQGFKSGNILIARKTDPDWVPVMRSAAAIVTDEGGKTSHAAIVARELGKPCIVGAHGATQKLDGKKVTVDCSTGGKGIIYETLLPLSAETLDLKPAISLKKRLRTKMMFILADPSSAERYHAYPNDGIGLARLEFVMENMTRIHPRLALGEKLTELTAEELNALTILITGYPNVTEYFVSKLADGIAGLAASVYPNQVIVRFSDFKSNEYRGLLGGRLFEPHEENPMLGFRGASRYYHPDYINAFHLECRAIKMVREERGFENVKVMIPFCRTPAEAEKVLQTMKAGGLVRGASSGDLSETKDGLEVYMMVEIPVNVLMLEEFAPYFDGFSIGSNDLTQLTLGIDRDAGALAHIADERNLAVRTLIKMAIRKARLLGKPIGICGQAPSNHPEYAEFLVECGIDSISVMPDAIPQTIENVLLAERKFNWKLNLKYT